MSKHRVRHRRAYAAGARDALEQVRSLLLLSFPARHHGDINFGIDNLRRSYPMPPPDGVIEDENHARA